ncbi:PilZ domain-containing protein [Zoogloea sp.]|uniref:PilZ domain-containing protein n=1 Tax=Zoogloea sp. TaxID=49181 RepID=UPI0026152011|nr:PilZ domain-containing protein [Zoogloea sp.]MDD3352790.1 PilZ domain-containing protein [Zoogloea sp.]
MGRMTERRRDRRIPLGCKVGLKFRGHAAPVVGDCIELSVSGMTIHSRHVPQMDEVFEVAVLPPEHGGPFQPLHARVRVRRCHNLGPSGLYEMGVEIIEIIR